MNRIVWDYLSSKMDEDGRRRRNPRTGRYMRDRAMDRRDREESSDYEDYRDERRNRRRDYDEYDYESSHHEKLELNKSDMYDWKQKMRNADGSRGAHYDMQQIVQVAEKLGIKFNDFDEKEFCMTVNMMYSDYCTVISKYVPHEKSLMFYAEMAKAFLEDEDAPEGSEKLALYYHCIVSGEEV